MTINCTQFPHCLAGACNPECPMAATNTRRIEEPETAIQAALAFEEEADQ